MLRLKKRPPPVVEQDQLKSQQDRIEREMRERHVKFDLSGEYYIKYQCLTKDCPSTNSAVLMEADEPELTSCPGCREKNWWKTFGKKWVYTHADQFWELLETTDDIRVPAKSSDWLVGQEMPLKRFRLEVARWIDKVKTIQGMLKQGIDPSGIIKERPGPYVLFISEPGCLTGDTRVVLEDGSLAKLKELGGEHLQSIDVGLQTTDGVDRAKVFHFYRNQPTLRIVMRSGRELVGTHNHPMMTKEGWKRLDAVSPGDFIRSLPFIKATITECVPTNWTRPLVSRRTGTGTYLTYDTFRIPSVYSPRLAYLAGYLLGDGSVRRGINLYVADNEKELVPHLVDIIQNEFHLSPRVAVRLAGKHRKVPIHNLGLGSDSLAALFDSSGVPEFVFRSPDDVVAQFLRGLFDSDGHVTSSVDKRDGSRSFVVGLKQKDVSVLRDVQLLLLRFGIHARVYPRSSLLKIQDNWSVLQYERYIGFVVRHKAETLSRCQTSVKRIVRYDRDWDKVMRVELGPVQDVYDIEVPESHSFLAAGLVSHNTGKSLLIKIAIEEMEELYREHGIELSDVLTLENKMDKYRPLVREVPEGMGQRIIKQAERDALNQQRERQQVIFVMLGILLVFGGALLMTALFIMGVYTMAVGIADAWFLYMSAFLPLLIPGAFLTVFPLMLLMFRGSTFLSVDQKELLNVPCLIVDNGPGRKLVINATVTNPETMFGDIKWNALGDTPGMTPPLHTRVVAGDVHRGHFKLIYIDEIRNTSIPLVIEFLTVMEDNELPIKAHPTAAGGSHGSSILSIATADPVPCNFMLVAAGNMDVLYNPASTLNQVPAFKDRFNYGDIIYFETHMDATIENEVKITQVITDEIYRFGLKPIDKDGLRLIVEYMRSRAENNKRFRVMWRYVIKVIIKSYEVMLDRTRGHGTLVDGKDVREAIDIYCRSIESQAMDEQLQNRAVFKLTRSTGGEYGVVNGLSVVGVPGAEGRSAGQVNPVAAVVFPVVEKRGPRSENFVVTGTVKDQESWVQDSKQHVRAAILKLYGVDIMEDHKTFISFAQSKGVEGPSAGTTMTLAIMSSLGDPRLPLDQRKPVPVRQDVAVTGTVELVPTPGDPRNVRVGAIGGVADKIQGAADSKVRYVIIPMENFEHTLTQEKYPCEVFGADSILGYFDLIRGDQKNIEELLMMRKSMSMEEISSWSRDRARTKARVVPDAR